MSLMNPVDVQFLCRYTPPIRVKEYSIYQTSEDVWACVSHAAQEAWLPVRGYPQQLKHDPSKLKQFFSACYFTTEISDEGRYVRATETMRGGMITDQDHIPWYPGYALGHIIKKTEVMYPLLISRRTKLQEQFNDEEKKYRSKLIPPGTVELTKKQWDQQSRLIAESESELNRIEADIKELDTQIDVIIRNRSKTSPIREVLPIASPESVITNSRRVYPSEIMSHILIQGEGSGVASLYERINTFVKGLLPKNAPSFIPENEIKEIADTIQYSVKNAEGSISLVGSFVTLPTICSMEPIKFRKNASVSELLKTNARDYYVLSEAILGGLFIGHGFYAKGTHHITDKPTSAEVKKIMSEISVFAFRSFGIIPPLVSGGTLLDAYHAWHDSIQKGGFPIAFRFTELEHVLQENGIG